MNTDFGADPYDLIVTEQEKLEVAGDVVATICLLLDLPLPQGIVQPVLGEDYQL
jgi:hypothetical protein